MLREARLVNQVPREIRHVMESCNDGGDQSLLPANRRRIEKRIPPTKNVRQECEEVELHGQSILARSHQIGFDGTQSALVRLAVLVAELVPAGPPPGADHVQARIVNLPEVLIPHIHIRMLEVQAL